MIQKMLKYFLCLIFIELIIGTFQWNLYYIDEIDENDNEFQHNCLRFVINKNQRLNYSRIISYWQRFTTTRKLNYMRNFSFFLFRISSL